MPHEPELEKSEPRICIVKRNEVNGIFLDITTPKHGHHYGVEIFPTHANRSVKEAELSAEKGDLSAKAVSFHHDKRHEKYQSIRALVNERFPTDWTILFNNEQVFKNFKFYVKHRLGKLSDNMVDDVDALNVAHQYVLFVIGQNQYAIEFFKYFYQCHDPFFTRNWPGAYGQTRILEFLLNRVKELERGIEKGEKPEKKPETKPEKKDRADRSHDKESGSRAGKSKSGSGQKQKP